MGDFGLHHIAALNGGKIILPCPSFGVEFANRCQFAGLEGFEQNGGVAIEFDPHLVEIVGSAPERQIAPPIVRVAAEGDVTAGFEILDDIGA